MTNESTTPRDNRREAVVFLLILVIAAVARLGWPGLTEFKADEGRLLTLALRMSDGEWAVRGISSSVGFPNAPMSVWLYSLPLFIRQHAYAATLFTGALGVAAVAGVYWLARRHGGGATGAAFAALMLAVSPWAIVFSRKIWAQNLLPAVAVAWAVAATLAFVDGRRPYIALHLLCLAVAAQIHPAAAGLAPATLLFLIVFRRRVDWRYAGLGVMLALLTAAPFLWYLWGRMRVEGGLPSSSGQVAGGISLQSLRLTLDLIAGAGLRPLAGAEYNGLPGEDIVRWLWVGFVALAAGWAVWRLYRRRDKREEDYLLICLAWLLGPIILFAWRWTPIYIHYFIVALPAACVLAGAFFAWGVEGASRGQRALAWSLCIVVALTQLASWAGIMSAVARDPAAGGFGIPLGTKLAAADAARRLAGEHDASEVLLAGDGANPDQDDFPAEFRALLHGFPVRFVDLNREAVFPAETSVVLLGSPAADELTSTRDLYLEASEMGETVQPGTSPFYTVALLPGAAAPVPKVALDEPALLANFVQLVGHDEPREVTRGVLWDVQWQTADNPDPSDFHLFNHLLDAAGRRVAQSDAAAFAGPQWLPGDIVISRFFLPLPTQAPRPWTMRVGMYRFPSLENVPVLDEAANPLSDAVEFPLTP
jgi:4-amino-4-deoxy-L-arabinose transferase-like glycosyltransferase